MYTFLLLILRILIIIMLGNQFSFDAGDVIVKKKFTLHLSIYAHDNMYSDLLAFITILATLKYVKIPHTFVKF